MIVQLDVTLRDYDSVCTLSCINKQRGENGGYLSDFCVHAWRLRSEYLENLGCHDPAFG